MPDIKIPKSYKIGAYDYQSDIDKINQDVIILGKNGAGKSSFLELISNQRGLVNPHVTFAYTPQLIYTNYSLKYAMRKIKFLYGFGIAQKDIDKLLSTLNLAWIKNKPYKRLSDGQKKVFLIFINLITKANYHIIDEFDVGLDVMSKKNIFDSLAWLKKSYDLKYIFSTHNRNYFKDFNFQTIIINKQKVAYA